VSVATATPGAKERALLDEEGQAELREALEGSPLQAA
jgi:hypothetical protein